ncbi:MAG: alkaline shock response membrane anchor protein AmaP [Opitutaceae bacterium]|nr:alkaline shock response membrane anchor protein AmaP [Opitutaceae bacterium]
MTENFVNSSYFPYVVCGSTLLFFLLILLRIFWKLTRQLTAFNDENGSVTISQRAIRQMVKQCCEQLGTVGRAHPVISIHRNQLKIKVKLRVKKNANLKGIAGFLKEQITQVLADSFGIEEISELDIVVIDVLPEDATPPEER